MITIFLAGRTTFVFPEQCNNHGKVPSLSCDEKVSAQKLAVSDTLWHVETSRAFSLGVGIRRLTAWQVPQSSRSLLWNKKDEKRQVCSREVMHRVIVGDPSDVIEQISDLLRSLPMDKLAISTRFQTISVRHRHLRQTIYRSDISHVVMRCKKNRKNVSQKYAHLFEYVRKNSSPRSDGT
jgi:hypothetical protein